MKSIGHGITTPKDLTSPEEVWLLILSLMQDVGEKLRFHQKLARGIAIECKDCNFLSKSFQKRLPQPSNCTMTLAKETFLLFRERYLFHNPIRAISVRAIDLERQEGEQLSLFTEKKELRDRVLDLTRDKICLKYGKNSLMPASLLHHSLPDQNDYVPFSAPR
jgi:DNA polymerase-4